MVKLRYNFVWLLSAQVIFSGLQFGIVVALARLTDATTLGAYSLALAVTTPLVGLCALGLRTVFTTDYSEKFTSQHYLWLRAWGVLVAAALIVVAAWFYRDTWLAAMAILCLGFGKLAESFSDMYYAFKHKAEEMHVISKSIILRAALSTTIFVGLLCLNAPFVVALGIYALSWWGLFFFYDRTRFGVPAWGKVLSPVCVKPLFVAAFPLGIASTIYMVAQNGVRYVIEHQLGLEMLGQFSAVAYGIMLGQIVVNVLGNTLRPRMAKVLVHPDGEGRADFLRLVRWGLFLCALLGTGLWGGTFFFGAWALGVVYGTEYVHLQPLFVALGAASIPFFMGTYLGFVLSATGAYWQTLWLSIIAVVASMGSAWVLIPTYGLLGAAYATGFLGVIFCSALPLVWLKMRK